VAVSADGGNGKKSFWQTLPGMLTATAGLITAVTGLIVAVEQLRPTHSQADGTALNTVPTNAPPSDGAVSTPLTTKRATAPGGATSGAAVVFVQGRLARIGTLLYEITSARGVPDNPGERRLVLNVKLTNNGRYDANFWAASFRLRTAAHTAAPAAPTDQLDDVVHGGTDETAQIDFVVPAAARQATLLIGDDPPHAVALPLRLVPR
jgi:hypothetical protein